MLLSLEAPQSPFPNLNPVELDEMIMPEYPPFGDQVITTDQSSAIPTQTPPKKRGKMSREGFEPYQMTDDELQQLNDKWVYWMNQLQHTIRWYAWNDEDLTQIGIINLRKTLCENINAPPNHLLHRAKLAIWMAASYGKSVDSPKSDTQNQRCRKGGINLVYTDGFDNPYDNPLLEDRFNYPPDVLASDQVAYENFRADLTVEEAKLLDLMIEGQSNLKKGPSGHKKMFIRETGSSYSNYECVNMSLKQQYYHHYGTEEQKEEFEEFYANWIPRQPMYYEGMNK